MSSSLLSSVRSQERLVSVGLHPRRTVGRGPRTRPGPQNFAVYRRTSLRIALNKARPAADSLACICTRLASRYSPSHVA